MMSKRILTCLLTAIMGVFLLPTANSLECFQCSSTDSTNPFQCNEFMPEDSTLQPTSCDNIDNAQYCVKFVGRAQGAIKCYQCDSSINLKCSDIMIHDNLLEPKECSYLANPTSCFKGVSRYAGTLGTIRGCSANDLGNQCMEVRQVGDQLRYRSCLYTCNTDGCNSSSSFTFTKYLLVLSGAVSFAFLL